ncbi:MAG TPA: TolC family protein, partial [Thermoanaerobaculia bacterium]
TPFTVEPVAAATAEESDLEAARARARERRPDLAQGRLQKRQAEIDSRLTRADRIPDLSFAVTYYSNLGLSVLPRNFTQIGLQLSWEPFDWGRRRHQEADKERAVTEADNALREAERQALLDVDRRFRQLDLARRQIDVRRLAEEAAAERLRVLRSRFAEQAALLKDVLAAEQTHAQAAADRQQALLGYWTARADFAQALGEEP